MPQRTPTYLHSLHHHNGTLVPVTSPEKIMAHLSSEILAGRQMVLDPALPVLLDPQAEALATTPPQLVWHWLAKEQVKLAWAIACQYNAGIHGVEAAQVKAGLARLLAIAAHTSVPNEDGAIKLVARWYGLRFTMLLILPELDETEPSWSVRLGVKPDFDILFTPRSYDSCNDTMELISLRTAARRLTLA